MSAMNSTASIEVERSLGAVPADVKSVHSYWTRTRFCYISSVQTDFDARTFHRQCVPLAALGMDVSFVGPHPKSECVDGVKIIATPRQRNRLKRMLSTPLLLVKALQLRADFYFLNDPELLPIGLFLKLLSRGKVVYDSREDYPDMMLTKKYMPGPIRPILANALAVLERLCAYVFDGIMTADGATLRRIARVGGSQKLVLYNFPSLSLFPSTSTVKNYDFVYRGGLSHRAGTWILLDALSILMREGYPAKTLIIGYADTPADWDDIAARIEALGLKDWIALSGRINHEKMFATLSQARVGICPLLPIPKFLRNIPVKVFEYWACGLAIVASDLPPIRPFVTVRQNGILVRPGDPRCLADAMRVFLDHPTESARMGSHGRDVVEKRLNSKLELLKFVRFINRMG